MRLLFFNSIGRSVWGGGEKWMLAAGTGLRARGHEIAYAGRPGGQFLARAVEAGFTTLPLAVRGDFDPRVAWQLGRHLRRTRTEVIVANFNKDVRLSALARGPGRQPKIIARNGLPIVPDRRRYRWLYRRQVACIVTNTAAIRERYLGYGWMPPEFVRVVHNGIDAGRLRATLAPTPETLPEPPAAVAARKAAIGLAPDAPVVTLCGRLVGQKRPDHFLAAAQRMAPHYPELQLLIVGEGPLEAEIRERAARNGLGARLHLPGFQRDCARFLAASDVVLLPSQDEGLPNVAMEAMALGRPVVGYDVGGVAELLAPPEAGRVVAYGDVAGLARQALALLDQPETAHALGARAAERIAREFSLETMVRRFEAVLEEVC